MLLRDYQRSSVESLENAFARGSQAVVLTLPTGAGKTCIACEIMRRALLKKRRVLFVVHRVELIDQAIERLRAFDIPAGVILSKREEARHHPIQVASIQTLARREPPQADIVFLDEAHHCSAPSWMRMLDLYPDAWIIGLTATPARLDGKPLRPPFDTLVVGCTTRALCDAGHLVNSEVYSHPSEPDLSGLKSVAGDYERAGLAQRCSNSLLIGAIVDHWKSRTPGERTLCFAVDIAHSQLIVDDFVRAGIRAEHLDGKSPDDVRAATLARLRSGETQIVSNCALFGEGYDLPELSVVISARPTKSLVLWRQMVGRVMRPAPGKARAVVLDHAGNCRMHGLPTDEIEWSLDGKPKKPPLDAVRICKGCYGAFEGDYPCPLCGYEPERTARDGPEHVNGELQEVLDNGPVVIDRMEWYADRVREASEKRRKLGWARRAYQGKFGVWPRGASREVENEFYICGDHRLEPTDWGLRCSTCLRS